MVERAERFLPEMAKNPPVLEGSLTLLDKEEDEVAADGAENLTMRRQGLFFQITGKIDPQYLDWDSKIYLRINGQMVYEAFPRAAILPSRSIFPRISFPGRGIGWKSSRTAEKRLKKYMIMK